MITCENIPEATIKNKTTTFINNSIKNNINIKNNKRDKII
jgi:hypothetical protein